MMDVMAGKEGNEGERSYSVHVRSYYMMSDLTA